MRLATTTVSGMQAHQSEALVNPCMLFCGTFWLVSAHTVVSGRRLVLLIFSFCAYHPFQRLCLERLHLRLSGTRTARCRLGQRGVRVQISGTRESASGLIAWIVWSTHGSHWLVAMLEPSKAQPTRSIEWPELRVEEGRQKRYGFRSSCRYGTSQSCRSYMLLDRAR